MRAIWVVIIAILVVLVLIIVAYFGFIEPAVTSNNVEVEERYNIDSSNNYRVFRITTSKDAIIRGIDNVANHSIDGDNHYLYLKKNVTYKISVNQKSKHAVMWEKA
jgi:hypothetical protein